MRIFLVVQSLQNYKVARLCWNGSTKLQTLPNSTESRSETMLGMSVVTAVSGIALLSQQRCFVKLAALFCHTSPST